MLDKDKLKEVVENALAETEAFLVEITVTPANEVEVTIDSPEGTDIEMCVWLTRRIEEQFDRDAEDYELTVGSAGVTAPFTVPQQYFMNIGNEVTVLTGDSRKLHGVLTEVADDLSRIVVEVPSKVKEPGAKRPVLKNLPVELTPENIRRIEREI